MRLKAAFIGGAALGYVFGTAAGRRRFEQLKQTAGKVWANPAVQTKVSEAEQKMADVARATGAQVQAKVVDLTGGAAAKAKVGGAREPSGAGTQAGSEAGSPPGAL